MTAKQLLEFAGNTSEDLIGILFVQEKFTLKGSDGLAISFPDGFLGNPICSPHRAAQRSKKNSLSLDVNGPCTKQMLVVS